MFYFILENPLTQFLSRANLKNPYTSKTLGRLLKSFALTGIIMIIFGFSAVQLVYNWRTGWRGCLPHTVRGLVIRGSLYWCFTAGFSLFLFIYLFIFFTEFPAYSIILKQLSREIRARSLDTAYLRTKDSPLTGLPKIGRARACTLAVETCDLVSLRRIFERAKEGFLEAPIKAALAVLYWNPRALATQGVSIHSLSDDVFWIWFLW